jgi:hypothetical protein
MGFDESGRAGSAVGLGWMSGRARPLRRPAWADGYRSSEAGAGRLESGELALGASAFVLGPRRVP